MLSKHLSKVILRETEVLVLGEVAARLHNSKDSQFKKILNKREIHQKGQDRLRVMREAQ
jgi:hypothetical protein